MCALLNVCPADHGPGAGRRRSGYGARRDRTAVSGDTRGPQRPGGPPLPSLGTKQRVRRSLCRA
eukprot:8165777-Pyramimonas_sp.AAC.1